MKGQPLENMPCSEEAKMGFGTPPVTKHTELTDKEVAGVLDHADDSVTTPKVKDLNITDPKLASGVGLQDTQICKLPVAVLDQILKRGAAAWEPGDAPAPALEGDYSSYSEKWSSETWAVHLMYIVYGAIDVNSRRVYLQGDQVYAVLDLDDGTVIETEGVAVVPTSRLILDKSIQSKYAAHNLNDTTIKVYKDGSLLQTITRPGAELRGVVMCHNGQFIILYDEDDYTVYCFEGS